MQARRDVLMEGSGCQPKAGSLGRGRQRQHTCLTAVPSAKASTLERVTRRPSARDMAMALAPTVSTPITLTCAAPQAHDGLETPDTDLLHMGLGQMLVHFWEPAPLEGQQEEQQQWQLRASNCLSCMMQRPMWPGRDSRTLHMPPPACMAASTVGMQQTR